MLAVEEPGQASSGPTSLGIPQTSYVVEGVDVGQAGGGALNTASLGWCSDRNVDEVCFRISTGTGCVLL